MKKNYVWHKQSASRDFENIFCPAYDPIKDFRRDPSGAYVLIRINQKSKFMEVAVCDKNHVIQKAFRGKKCQDLYFAIFEYAKQRRLKWFTRMDHAAYLGKELKKAEYALAGREKYVQE